jgi:hypothetical protein
MIRDVRVLVPQGPFPKEPAKVWIVRFVGKGSPLGSRVLGFSTLGS